MHVFIRLFSNRIHIDTGHRGSTGPTSYVCAFLVCLLLKITSWKLLRITVFYVWISPYHLLKGDQLMCVILKPVFEWADDGRVDGQNLESFKCGSPE